MPRRRPVLDPALSYLSSIPIPIRLMFFNIEQQVRAPRVLRRTTLPTMSSFPWEDNGDYNAFINWIHPFHQQDVRVALLRNGRLVHSFIVRGERNFKLRYLSQWFEGPSDDGTFLPNMYRADEIRIYRTEDVTPQELRQVFRDSNNQCVFRSLERKLTSMPPSLCKKTQYNRQSKLNTIERLKEQYPDGVQESDLSTIAHELKAKFILDDVLNNTVQEYGKSTKLVIHLTNTRKDHVDYMTDKEPIEVSQEEMNELFRVHKHDHYVVKNRLYPLRTLSTPNGTYIVKNPHQELLSSLNEQIKHAWLDANKHSVVADFLLAGNLINSQILQLEPLTSNTRMYDMKKAYTQFKQCSHYEGFPNQIQIFATTNKLHSPGIYQFTLHSDTPFSRKFGLIKNKSYILPSPEIKYWRQTLSLTITAGAYGSTLDLTLPSDPVFTEQKLYNAWFGKLLMQKNYPYTTHTFPGTPEFASHLKTIYPDTTYQPDEHLIEVKIPNKTVLIAPHIHAFITSYTRITMLEQMEGRQVKAVLLDGIWSDEPIDHSLFSEKYVNQHPDGFVYKNTVPSWYEPKCFLDIPTLPFTPAPRLALIGQGGSGKTTAVLTSKAFTNVLYVVPTHELGQKSGRPYITIQRLIGEQCEAIRTVPAILLIDELTMIPESYIRRAFAMYPTSLIFLAGDVDSHQHYQCRSGRPGDFRDPYIPTDIPIVRFTQDYRAQTDILKQWKRDLRAFMKHNYTDGTTEDTKQVRQWIRRNFPVMSLTDVIATASNDSVFLWSTHRVRDLIPDSFTKKGVQAYQGQTIQYPIKIYITLDFFEYAMPYTAMSRATHHDQIVFVQG